MTVLLSRDSYLGFRELSTTTGLLTVPAEFVFCESMAFKKDIKSDIIEELGVGARAMRRRVTTDVTAMGTFSKAVDVNNGIALYQYIQAGSASAISSGALGFLWTFAEGSELSAFGRLQFEYSLGNSSATTLRFFNGVVDSYQLKAQSGQIAKETWNLKFSDHSAAQNTVSTIAITQTNPIVGNRVSLRIGTSITTVSEVAAKDVSLDITNEIIETRELSTNTVRTFQYGKKSVKGQFQATFEDFTQYNLFLNQTYSAIQIQLTSEDVVSSQSLYIRHNIAKVFFTGSTPQVGINGPIVQQIAFEAIYGSEAGYMNQIQVLNGDATLSK